MSSVVEASYYTLIDTSLERHVCAQATAIKRMVL